jgi:hypothetical protein
MTDEMDPLAPSGLAQFIEHDRCPRYLNQQVDPGDEPDARPWKEAFGLMNVALLAKGKAFEADQVEHLATDASHILAPELPDPTQTGVPAVTVDETWATEPAAAATQITQAVKHAATLTPSADEIPYILLYQAPLSGTLGEQTLHGDADCIALAPAAAVSTDTDTDTGVVARVIDIKSAHEEQPAHRVQVATYCGLLEQTLAESACDIPVTIEASVLTQPDTDTTPPHAPFAIDPFRRAEWELFVTQLLAADGPVENACTEPLQTVDFTLDQVCNNCAYQEACATRAVEHPRRPQSLAVLGLDIATQHALEEAGLTSLHDVATLAPPRRETAPMDAPPPLDLPADRRRALEDALSMPIYELVLRAQALYGELEPEYPAYETPPAIPGNDWVPLPDDRCEGWSNLEAATPGELVTISLFIRPDPARNRLGAVSACVTAEAYDDYHTISEVTEAVPDEPACAEAVEARLLTRFLTELFETIEQVATAIGEPEATALHWYTYSDHELDALLAALERHADTIDRADTLRAFCSVDADGHTEDDQSMVSVVHPIVNEYFGLTSVSQGLLSVTAQFDPEWTLDTFDPPGMRPSEPPLRDIFHEQFLDAAVPYEAADTGMRLQLTESPPTAGTQAATDDPDGWYRIRSRSGGQFPLEYLWAAVPTQPGDETPRLHPDVVEQWALDDAHRPLYRQEITRFYQRTAAGDQPITRRDVGVLTERLSYALHRLVAAIPYKDAYHPKEPIDATRLAQFQLPVTTLPAAARDYLRMEFGAARDTTIDHYRSSLRARARSGRSMPIRCTNYTQAADGTLTITAELAYDALFTDSATATRVAHQTRLRSTDGTSGGSWRLLTRLQATPETTPSATGQPQPALTAAVTQPEDTKHSPPVFIEALDLDAGTITLTALPHRFRQYGSPFRVAHCGWTSPSATNLKNPALSPAERPGYIADREPVWIDIGEVYTLDPMVDAFGAPKADRALAPETVAENACWTQLQALADDATPPTTHRLPTGAVARADAVTTFTAQMAASDACLTPNAAQQQFIEAVNHPLVPLQGPPGTGKTSGATAPALLARAYANAQNDAPFTGVVVAPSHEAVDAVLSGVVDSLDSWRRDHTGLETLELLRVTPTPVATASARVDTAADQVSVTYAAYHTDVGTETIQTQLAVPPADGAVPRDTTATQRLLFVTPSTLYAVLGALAERTPAIDGTTAPAAMRHPPGIADVVCLDEASMIDIPQLFLATSALKPAGQTLFVGDHRQLATVSAVTWAETRRRPVTTTGAYHSALGYVLQYASTQPSPGTPDGGQQSVLDRFTDRSTSARSEDQQ